MLVTNDCHELIGHSYLTDSKERIWSLVNFDLEIPYFLVTYQIQEGSCSVNQTTLLWRLSDLLGLCAKIKNEIGQRLIRIALLSPSWMNRNEGWQADSIKEIWDEHDSSGKHCAFSYVTEAGQRLFDSTVSSDEEETKRREMVFSFSRNNTYGPDQ